MAVPRYRDRWPVYAKEWDRLELTTHADQARAAAQHIIANKARYQTIQEKTDVPWYWLGPTHYRESDFSFNTQLAQGDPLDRVSSHVPRGLGPYFGPDAFERAAIEGLEHDDINLVVDWRLEKLIYNWEKWNGWGYEMRGVPSAYLWAGTNIYQGGFFVNDGQWVASAHDPRVGTVAILKALMELDSSIQPMRETPAGVPDPIPQPPEVPVPTPTPTPTVQLPSTTVLTPADIDAISSALAKKSQPMFAGLLSLVVGMLPQLGIWGLVAQQVLTAMGTMGPAIGAGATPTGQSVAATLAGMIVSGLLSQFNKGTQQK